VRVNRAAAGSRHHFGLPAMNAAISPAEKLRDHLTQRATKARTHARKNDTAATLCFVTAITGSFAATLCAALADLPRALIAGITAVPGTVLLLNSVFAFDQKCRWHRRRKLKYDAFLIRLTYENADPAAVSRELREFEEKIDTEYPRFGAPGKLGSAEG
jgi:hypothetical protein